MAIGPAVRPESRRLSVFPFVGCPGEVDIAWNPAARGVSLVLEMTLLAHLRTPRLDRDAAFDAAVREGTLPSQHDRCPYCGHSIEPGASNASGVGLARDAAAARGAPADSAPGAPVSSVDQELAVLSNGHAAS